MADSVAEYSRRLKAFYEKNVVVTAEVKNRLRPSRDWVVHQVQRQDWTDGPPVNQGSFYNGTVAGRPGDFDVLIPYKLPEAPFTARTVEPTGRVYFHLYDRHNRLVSSDDMLQKFYNQVRAIFPVHSSNDQTTMRRPAVSISLSTKMVKVDLVPCIKVNDALYIAKGMDENGKKTFVWKKCKPQEEKTKLELLARDNHDFKAIIRILKYVCKRNDLAISSHAIQSLVVRSCQNDTDWNRRAFYTNYLAIVKGLFAAVVSGVLKDWVFPSENMLEDVSAQERGKAVAVLQKIISSLESGRIENACM